MWGGCGMICFMCDHPIYDQAVWDQDERSFHPVCVDALQDHRTIVVAQPVVVAPINSKPAKQKGPWRLCVQCGHPFSNPQKWSNAHRWGCPSCKTRIV